MSPNDCSGRTLAFLGDAVWSLCVRHDLLEEGKNTGSKLQKLSVSYVSAKAQARFYEALHEVNFFTEAEEAVFHRGRNSHSGAIPHSTDAQTYRISTGFEAILGALYLEGKEDRIKEIFRYVKQMEEKR